MVDTGDAVVAFGSAAIDPGVTAIADGLGLRAVQATGNDHRFGGSDREMAHGEKGGCDPLSFISAEKPKAAEQNADGPLRR